MTGYIEDEDKGPLLAGAVALVYPSLYEGFGFPAIEAMICGTPVIASATSSLAELVGDAGLLVDPLQVEEIAAAMRQISDNGALRAELVERGSATRQSIQLGSLRAATSASIRRTPCSSLSDCAAICYNGKMDSG